ILEALRSRRKGLTTIFISHRLVGLESVDGVFLFEEGRVVESGRHQALMEQKGLYFRLYQRQRLEKELQEGVF
ncbi:MAG TPA: ABC transporter ATP-binding protein, partial [Thermodesulfobacteriota bacterium]|nr:ABC transporter ATP-binding protein [Thermodesulfobacteriota bacterium]